MPNHFHFMVLATEESAKIKKLGSINISVLSNGFRILQSKYAQFFNLKYNRSGALFRPKTKAKSLLDGSANYEYIAFHYIHQNALKAGLVKNIKDWRYSSFMGFAGLRNGTICNIELSCKLLGFEIANFIFESQIELNENQIIHIFEKGDKPL